MRMLLYHHTLIKINEKSESDTTLREIIIDNHLIQAKKRENIWPTSIRTRFWIL